MSHTNHLVFVDHYISDHTAIEQSLCSEIIISQGISVVRIKQLHCSKDHQLFIIPKGRVVVKSIDSSDTISQRSIHHGEHNLCNHGYSASNIANIAIQLMTQPLLSSLHAIWLKHDKQISSVIFRHRAIKHSQSRMFIPKFFKSYSCFPCVI